MGALNGALIAADEYDKAAELWENITYSYGQNKTTGVFNTHSPNRPNGIGVTAVDLLAMEDGVLTVDGADMMEGTPILDIKPMPHGGKP